MFVNSSVVDNVDPRNAFQRLNRQSLVWLLQANGVADVSDTMPKDKLEKIADINADDILEVRADGKYRYKNVVAYLSNNGETKIERPNFDGVEEPVKKVSKKANKPSKVLGESDNEI